MSHDAPGAPATSTPGPAGAPADAITPPALPAGRSARITGWGAYAPTAVLTNADLERIVDTSDEWIVSRTGIRERRVAAAHETTASMAAVAGARAIAVAGLDPDEIDLILVATLTPDYWMPSTASLVKEAIGNTRAAAMDVSAACSGFVYGYATAHAYVTSGMARHVLVVGAELLTRFLDYTDRATCILFGDGAGAVVVSASDGPVVPHGIELTTEPSGAYMIWLPAGGSKSPPSAATIGRGEHYIRMEGKETYRFATKTLASTALAAIARAGLRPDQIDLFIPHQANIRIIEAVAKGLGLSMDRMFVNLDRYGNTSAASVPLALAEAVDAGRIRPGDHVVIVAFGAGFTSGAVAFEWTADPAAGARAASIRPEEIRVRVPVDWDSVDPIPPQLAAVLAAPGPVTVPLDDVVPGDPPARRPAPTSVATVEPTPGQEAAGSPAPAPAGPPEPTPTEVSS
jgi:3-oxoacyl-[acyl-carrier-protein] synthase-3